MNMRICMRPSTPSALETGPVEPLNLANVYCEALRLRSPVIGARAPSAPSRHHEKLYAPTVKARD